MMMRQRSACDRWTRICLVALFVLAFLPRALTPVSRQLEWYSRPAQFITAVLEGRWSDTVFSEHPGVSVMWVVGIVQRAAYHARVALGQNPPLPGDIESGPFITELSIGVWALAACIACAIVLAWYPVKRLFGARVAWAAVLLMALDPYYIANSKVLHIDALVTALMTLSALTMLVYARYNDRRVFVTSAVCGGLALLTKAPSLFLLPFLALTLLVARGGEARFSVRWLLRRWALPLLVWIGIAVIIFVALYPAMWTAPHKVLSLTARRTVFHATTAHKNPVFFHGASHTDDPGPWYYVYTLAFKSSWVNLSLALLGLLTLWRLPRPERRSALLALAYIVCFGLQMTISAKKGLRYLLPLFPMFDVLAGLGWAAWQRGVARYLHRPCVSWAVSALPIVALAVMVLPLHPYYGTHYNQLWGGIRAAVHEFPLQEQAEGVDLAARWLDARGTASLSGDWQSSGRLCVAAQQPGILIQYTGAQIVEFDAPEVDYFVFDRNHIVRGYRVFEWGDVWKRYRSREPAFQASFRGEPYAWVYRALPATAGVTTPDHAFGGRLGDAIELVGYDWQANWVAPDEPLPLHLYWRAGQPSAADYTVFVHLHGPDGQLMAQCDSAPQEGARPTTTWQPGEVIPDTCEVVLPSDAPAGEYRVFVGMYSWPDLERLPARGPDGAELADGRLPLVTFELDTPHLPWGRMGLAWGAALIVLAAGVIGAWRGDDELTA